MYYLFLIYFRAWLPGSCSPRLALEGHWQNTHRQLDTNQWINEKNVCIHFCKICFTKRYYAWIPLFVRRLPYSCFITGHTSIWAPSTTGQHAYCIVLCSYCDDLNFQVQNYSTSGVLTNYIVICMTCRCLVFFRRRKQIYRKVALPNFKQYIKLYERITYLNLNYYLHWKGGVWRFQEK